LKCGEETSETVAPTAPEAQPPYRKVSITPAWKPSPPNSRTTPTEGRTDHRPHRAGRPRPMRDRRVDAGEVKLVDARRSPRAAMPASSTVRASGRPGRGWRKRDRNRSGKPAIGGLVPTSPQTAAAAGSSRRCRYRSPARLECGHRAGRPTRRPPGMRLKDPTDYGSARTPEFPWTSHRELVHIGLTRIR